jgi:hypothetical protein
MLRIKEDGNMYLSILMILFFLDLKKMEIYMMPEIENTVKRYLYLRYIYILRPERKAPRKLRSGYPIHKRNPNLLPAGKGTR